MYYETVHAVWHFHDQVRSGIADYQGDPHYFETPFDHDSDDYVKYFLLYPVGPNIMAAAFRQKEAFRHWEIDFRNGGASINSHPMLDENNPDYRERQKRLEDKVGALFPLPATYEGIFRIAPGQEALPLGVMRELEVWWNEIPPDVVKHFKRAIG